MDTDRKDTNIQIGKRLREARRNMNIDKVEIAEVLGVTVEHYRKFEAGSTGLSVDKILILYRIYGIDPTYLITGVSSNAMEFNLSIMLQTVVKNKEICFLTVCLHMCLN